MLEGIVGIKTAAILRKYGPYALIALAFGVLLLLAYCHGEKTGKSGAVIDEQERTIELQNKVGTADEHAANRRLSDQKALQAQKQELSHAIENGADADTVRILRGCVVMRQQGRDTSGIPACR